jgi:exopolysaccharide biosynthesis polyprenyl glycosylphosphotransferase
VADQASDGEADSAERPAIGQSATETPPKRDAHRKPGKGAGGRGSLLTILILLCVDCAALAVALVAVKPGVLHSVEYMAGFVIVLALKGGYRVRMNLRLADDFFRLVEALSLAFVAAALTVSSWPAFNTLLRSLVAAVVLVPLGRGAAYLLVTALRRHGLLVERALIVGSGEVEARILDSLRQHPEYGLDPMSLTDAPPGARGASAGVDGYTVCQAVRDLDVKHLILGYGMVADSELVGIVRECRGLQVKIRVVPRLFELGVAGDPSHVEDVWGLPLRRLPHGATTVLARRAKRAFDVVLGSLLLVLSGPVFIAAAVAVRLSSPGPVLFRQARTGQNGRLIQVLKFRTMLCNDDSDQTWCVADDDRRTYPGRFLRKTGLDELPQILNVLRGDMSLVGPRPERPYFAGRFASEIPRYADRQRVPQGITGWAQVHGLRGDTPISDRVMLDNYYIEHWSLWRDIQILARTVAAVLGKGGG